MGKTYYTELNQVATVGSDSNVLSVENIQSTFTDVTFNAESTKDVFNITVPLLEKQNWNNSGFITFKPTITNNANASIVINNNTAIPMVNTSNQSINANEIIANSLTIGKIYNNSFYILNTTGEFDGILSISKGGTGASNATVARANLNAAPAYGFGTEDLTVGVSPLDTGKLYFVYEVE